MPILTPLALALCCFAGPPAAAPAPAPPSPADVVAALEGALADAIARVEPSVVAISREKTETDETLAVRGRTAPDRPGNLERRLAVINLGDGTGGDGLSFDYGAGVVVGDKGEILTAYHVVRGAATLRVRAADRQSFAAEIIAADPRSDLAVIVPRETPNAPPPKLRPVTLGDASALRKGSFLLALGNPYNAAADGRPSASWGILANVARKLDPTPDEQARAESFLRNFPTLLQLDSKLNLGMSGGAVVNLKGELVGLTTAAANAAGFDGQAGYAIPMDALTRKVVDALKQGKEYEYGFLGIRLDMPHRTSRVMSADPGTPAALGDVLVDDVITAVGGAPVVDSDSLVVAINAIPAGEPVKLNLLRKNVPIERTVHLAKLRIRSPVIVTNRPEPWRGLRVDYTSALVNNVFGPDIFDAMSREGVVVTEVETGSEGEKAGLKLNQFVSRVDGRPVRNPRDFAKAVAPLKGPVRLDTDQGVVTVK